MTQRPWPRPRGPWVMHQSWHNLLFAHSPVPAAALQPYLPAGLDVETFDGQAWLGFVPFAMRNVRPRGIPPLPGLSAFPELNVRTYVTRDGKPGVWFFSLDAGNRLAVRIGRAMFHLPYYHARMAIQVRGSTVAYRSDRLRSSAPVRLAATYAPCGAIREARPGSLEYWLTARYCLYAADAQGRLSRTEIDHAPWPLQPATADFSTNTMTAPLQLPLPGTPPLMHFARQLDVVVWPPRALSV